MSAFICDPRTIGAAAAYIASTERADEQEARRLAVKLAVANVVSIDARYGEGEGEKWAGDGFAFECASAASQIIDAPVSKERTLGALQCLQYQSCEFEGYAKTEQGKITEEAIVGLVDAGVKPEGWDSWV